MTSLPIPRWAVSFADLLLLLLGCFVLLHAMEAARPRVAPGGAEHGVEAPAGEPAAALFQPGEALLTPEARTALRQQGERLAGHQVRIVSRGTAEGGGRLDRFELASARAAAVARALEEGGLSEGQVAISVENASLAAPQTILIEPV